MSKKRKYHQGIFKPKFPEKYVGDPNKIIYRSGLELRYFKRIDENPEVIKWASEEKECVIPYKSPIDGQYHRYFCDLLIKTKDNKVFLIEIKPKSQTTPPKLRGRKSKAQFAEEVMTWGVNQAKWEAAKAHCAKKGWAFQILTEEHI